MTKLAYTILAVRDLPRARKFYQDFFTQSVAVDMGKLIGFESGLALWEQDDMAEQSGLDAGILSGRGGMEIEFHTDDIEDLFQRLLSAGVEILHPVRAHPWGQLVFRCRDLDGHCIEVDIPLGNSQEIGGGAECRGHRPPLWRRAPGRDRYVEGPNRACPFFCLSSRKFHMVKEP